MSPQLLQVTASGLYCADGDFFVDPWKPVARAVITHAHSDHARIGSSSYLCAADCKHVLRARLGEEAFIETANYGAATSIGGVKVTLYPAGHILGSSQVAIERNGQTIVVSGDYKRQDDVTCQSFEPVRCHTFVTESTFGLPVYRWPNPKEVFEEINAWWRENQATGKCSVLLSYSLGKAQRILAGVDNSIGPIFCHGAVENLNEAYRASAVHLPATASVINANRETDWSQTLVIAPPSVSGSNWMKRLGKVNLAMASGWMQIRGTRRRRSMDRGFVLSDHVDWSDLMRTIKETEAEEVWATHGYSDVVVRYLNDLGTKARTVETRFVGSSPDETSQEDLNTENDLGAVKPTEKQLGMEDSSA